MFDSRVGALDEPAPPDAMEFIISLQGLFKYLQTLMYSLPVYKYVSTPTWRTFEQYGDRVHAAGLRFVEKVRTYVWTHTQYQV